MKKFITTLSICALLLPVHLFAEEKGEIWNIIIENYEQYQDISRRACGLTDEALKEVKPQLWKTAVDGKSSFSSQEFRYPSVDGEATAIEEFYRNRIDAEQNPTSKANLQKEFDDIITAKWIVKSISLASAAYRANMNTLYSCAIQNSKLNIIEQIEQYLPPDKRTSIQNRLKTIKDQLSAEMGQSCNRVVPEAWEGKDGSAEAQGTSMYRKQLLDKTAENYCYYRYYLEYINTKIVRNYDRMRKQNEALWWETSKPNYSTNSAALELAAVGKQIETEITRVKDAFPVALVAFRDFERTYGLHIVLTILIDDYQRTRDNLNYMISPMSQLMYKVYNSQSPSPPQC